MSPLQQSVEPDLTKVCWTQIFNHNPEFTESFLLQCFFQYYYLS